MLFQGNPNPDPDSNSNPNPNLNSTLTDSRKKVQHGHPVHHCCVVSLREKHDGEAGTYCQVIAESATLLVVPTGIASQVLAVSYIQLLKRYVVEIRGNWTHRVGKRT